MHWSQPRLLEVLVSGPVWQKFETEAAVCEKCLSETDSTFRQGEVVDGEFRPVHAYCLACYDENIDFIAQNE